MYCNLFTDKKLNFKKWLFNQQKLRNFHLQEILFQFWKHPPHLSDSKLWRQELPILFQVKATSDTSFSKGITTDRTYWSCILPHENIPLHVLRTKPDLSSFLHSQIHFLKWKLIIYQHNWEDNKSSDSRRPKQKRHLEKLLQVKLSYNTTN